MNNNQDTQLSQRIIAAELLGTALFVFFSSTLNALAFPSPLQLATGKGMILALLTLTLYSVSLAHFNPCVTFAMFLRGAISSSAAAIYLTAQFVGSYLGSLTLKFVIPPADHIKIIDSTTLSKIALHQAFFIEMLLTFFFIFTILRTLRFKKPFPTIAVVTGTALGTATLIGHTLSGSVLNYAYYLGPRLVFSDISAILSLSQLLTYLVAPLTGSLLAWACDRYFRCDSACMCTTK